MGLFRRRSKSPEKMKHLRGLVRVFAYLSATMLVFGLFTMRRAKAEFKDHTLVLGRQMMELAKAQNHGVTKLKFNGQTMYLGNSTTEDSPSAVLDRYEGHCKANPGQPSAGWEQLEKQTGKKADDAPAIVKSGVVRGGDDKEGTVVCFVRGPETKPTTQEAFTSLMQTGSLGSLGELRYAYVSKSEKSGKSLVLTAWTDSTFNLYDLIGDADKDSPGADFDGIPRVPSSIRTMSAYAEGTPYGVNVYRTSDAPSKVLAYYDKEMHERDWIVYDPELDEKEHGAVGHAYLKEGVVLTLAITSEPEGNFVALGLAGATAPGNQAKTPNGSKMPVEMSGGSVSSRAE